MKIIQWAALSIMVIGCSSTASEEKSSGQTTKPELQVRANDSYIPAEITERITSKRRARLKRLYADGPAWFQFKIEKPFQELQINLKGMQYTYSMAWSTEVDAKSEDPLPLQNVNQGDFNVDIVITKGKIEVYFNEGVETFSFNAGDQVIDARVELVLDKVIENVPGVLYDIGI